MHADISQGNFCASIYGETAGDQMEQPDLTLAFHTCRTPQCGHTVWGKMTQDSESSGDLFPVHLVELDLRD